MHNKSKAALDLTQGSIFQKLVLFSLPMMAGNLLQQFYNIVDTLIVGKLLGRNALAAVGASYTLMTFLTSLIIGLCMGSGALFSKWVGAQEKSRLKEDVHYSLVLIGTVTLVILWCVYAGMEPLLRLQRIPEEVFPVMKAYVQVVFAGIPLIFLYNFFAFFLRAKGNSLVPLCFLGVSSLLNVAGDLWFVAGAGMGVEGTALATVLAQAVSGIGIAIYTLRREWLTFRPDGSIRYSRRRMRAVLWNDLTTGLQQSVMNFGILMIQGLVNSFGTVVMAAFAAAVKVDTIAYMPVQEFGNAYSLYVSQNYGAAKPERIQKGTRIAVVSALVFCLLISGCIWLGAPGLMGLFIEGKETEIILTGAEYLRIEGAFYLGIGWLFLLYGYFRGIQLPWMSLVLTIVSLGTRVLLAYSLAPAFGVKMIWWAIPIGWALADVTGFTVMRFKKNNIKRRKT